MDAPSPARPRGQSFVTPSSALRPGMGDKAKSWRWLGNFKRSLSYGEESSSSSNVGDITPASSEDDAERGVGDGGRQHSFSEDDLAALDAVFKNEGTKREAERMRSVLTELADALARLRERATTPEEAESRTAVAPLSSSEPERLVELLLEVRDICQGDRTDFSLAFAAMGGLDVLLGCASERSVVPKDVRSACFLVLSSVAMGSVPVQYRLLNEGAVSVLASLYFAEFPREDVEDKDGDKDEEKKDGNTAAAVPEADESGTLRGRIVQAIDAAVVCHGAAERRFCSSERGRCVVEAGMGVPGAAAEALPSRRSARPPAALRKRCLSLLRELLTSRFTSQERVELFSSAIRHAATDMTVPATEDDERIREMALGLVLKVLRQKKKGASVIIGMKDELEKLGEGRIEEIRSMDAVEREVVGETERDLWFRIVTELGRA